MGKQQNHIPSARQIWIIRLKVPLMALLTTLMCLLMSKSIAAQEPQLQLNTTIKGNMEQPKVLYIMPWQTLNPTIESSEQAFKPNLNALIAPIDREHFIQEIQLKRSTLRSNPQ